MAFFFIFKKIIAIGDLLLAFAQSYLFTNPLHDAARDDDIQKVEQLLQSSN